MELRVSIRSVQVEDLPIFFDHQLDAGAAQMAAFPSRDREAFFTHWHNNILGNPTAVCRTILEGTRVAGNVVVWTDAESGERLVGYWLGREFWGRGIATIALQQFLQFESTRPLGARVAKHNFGSSRVLEKAGFVRAGEDAIPASGGVCIQEWIYRLSG